MHSILIATKEDAHREEAVSLLEKEPEWRLRSAANKREMLQILSVEHIDLLLTDGQLPDKSQEELLAEIRERFPSLPVVLTTLKAPNESLVRALRLGAASYVPRSLMARDLQSTVARVLALCGRYKLSPDLLACRKSTQSTFVLPNEPSLFQAVIAYIQDELERFQGCEPNERVNMGIAVEEALLNAMIHGNLEIGPEVREEGFEQYEAVVAQRQKQSPYRERTITVVCAFSATDATIRVIDEGPGFDVSSLPDPTRPENLGKSGGRGLLLIRAFLDDVQFNEKGNEIRMIKKRASS